MTYDTFDVVVVPFPFTDRSAAKRRPALVVSRHESFSAGPFRRERNGAYAPKRRASKTRQATAVYMEIHEDSEHRATMRAGCAFIARSPPSHHLQGVTPKAPENLAGVLTSTRSDRSPCKAVDSRSALDLDSGVSGPGEARLHLVLAGCLEGFPNSVDVPTEHHKSGPQAAQRHTVGTGGRGHAP